jgi:hypothetical protein
MNSYGPSCLFCTNLLRRFFSCACLPLIFFLLNTNKINIREKNSHSHLLYKTYIQTKILKMSNAASTVNQSVSHAAIIAAVISSIVGIAICVACCVFIICLIKRFKSPRGAATYGIFRRRPPPNSDSVPNYPPPYPNIVPNYPPQYPDYVSNYPPQNLSGYPTVTSPYINDESQFTKMPNP